MQVFNMTRGAGHMKIMCPQTGLGVFHYFTCGNFSFQTSAASRLSTINPVSTYYKVPVLSRYLQRSRICSKQMKVAVREIDEDTMWAWDKEHHARNR
ncbi:hypothetical protein PoB_007414500 [Plakobranchus ocellatus]|uniref:Uncharacterized protein n=1 Tax=Plakobranchus ocellatus TaxID=259542 RepID=A0AAV4DUC9_9GAST|nr:hypothetical protein PoB_007414500 [Plakobranchus ocellatus]